MRKIIFIFFGFLLYSCKNTSSENLLIETEKRERLNINEETLNGKWYLNKWTCYHTLDFNGDSIYVDNNIDSVFYLKYKLKIYAIFSLLSVFPFVSEFIIPNFT